MRPRLLLRSRSSRLHCQSRLALDACARLGDLLYVNDPERKVEISGRLASLSDRELSIDGYRFAPKPILKIQRRGDTIPEIDAQRKAVAIAISFK